MRGFEITPAAQAYSLFRWRRLFGLALFIYHALRQIFSSGDNPNPDSFGYHSCARASCAHSLRLLGAALPKILRFRVVACVGGLVWPQLTLANGLYPTGPDLDALRAQNAEFLNNDA